MSERQAAYRVLLPMSERQLQQCVYDLARLLGWRCYHTWDSRHSAAGFPDLLCVREERIIAIELKRDARAAARVTVTQTAWLEAFSRAHVETALWWDEHWHSGEIEQSLKGERP